MPVPVLIDRSLLVEPGSDSTPHGPHLDALIALQRQGRRILLVSIKPSGWRPTRRSVDSDLVLQHRFYQLFMRAGAELDGILYLSPKLFGRRQRYVDEFERTAQRYDCKASEMSFVSADHALIGIARSAGLDVIEVAGGSPPAGQVNPELESVLKRLQ